jgi:hypothetical protein
MTALSLFSWTAVLRSSEKVKFHAVNPKRYIEEIRIKHNLPASQAGGILNAKGDDHGV